VSPYSPRVLPNLFGEAVNLLWPFLLGGCALVSEGGW
jgi:hypothetical protein